MLIVVWMTMNGGTTGGNIQAELVDIAWVAGRLHAKGASPAKPLKLCQPEVDSLSWVHLGALGQAAAARDSQPA